MRYFIFLSAILLVSSIAFLSWKRLPSIPVQTMKMQLPKGSKIFKEELLRGEIAETKIEHIAFAGPISKKMVLPKDSSSMFIFIKGKGSLKTDAKQYDIAPETIALPFAYTAITLQVAKGDTLHYVLFTKKLTEQDIKDLKEFPEKNKYDIFFTKFSDCEPYTEKIKSPNTVSRTVLPADILPRVSLGTVETKGPDAVGAHAHPMLDQLFLSLAGNEIVVHADEQSTVLKEYSLLHIPLGSTHWATVGEGKKMYYLWMDFFMTKEGQEWLKTHKPISKKME
jgi:quercetin dioxygenase-like cupin family protein